MFKSLVNYIYIHIYCINNYLEILNYLINCIKESGLYAHIKEIRCGVLYNNKDDLKNILTIDPKIIIAITSLDKNLYERLTINLLYEDSKKEEFNVLYLHTKGVTKPRNVNIKSWVEYMCYFNIYNYKICLQLLDQNDTVGVNLQDRIKEEVHYAGNFWWSKSKYIRKLIKCIDKKYNAPEFWLTKDKIGSYASLWHSNCPHYKKRYDSDIYKNKGTQIYRFNYK